MYGWVTEHMKSPLPRNYLRYCARTFAYSKEDCVVAFYKDGNIYQLEPKQTFKEFKNVRNKHYDNSTNGREGSYGSSNTVLHVARRSESKVSLNICTCKTLLWNIAGKLGQTLVYSIEISVCVGATLFEFVIPTANIFKYSFFPRTFNEWKSLSEDIVHATSGDSF